MERRRALELLRVCKFYSENEERQRICAAFRHFARLHIKYAAPLLYRDNLQKYIFCVILGIEKDNRPQGGLPG